MRARKTASDAEAFRARHAMPPPLLLPNAWDAMSARAFADAGFAWIATTSAGVAWSLGYTDGEVAPWPKVVAATARIVRAARCPVSADIEAGYGATPKALEERAKEIIRTGIVGLNLEDGTPHREPPIRDLDEQCTRIAAIRRAAEIVGVPLVINARIDLFLRRVGDEPARISEAIKRAKAYLAAGADCVYPIALADPEIIGHFVRAVSAPVNIAAHAGMPNVAALGRLGVARISIASSAALAALALTRRLAVTLRASGGFDCLAATLTHAEAQRLLTIPEA